MFCVGERALEHGHSIFQGTHFSKFDLEWPRKGLNHRKTSGRSSRPEVDCDVSHIGETPGASSLTLQPTCGGSIVGVTRVLLLDSRPQNRCHRCIYTEERLFLGSSCKKKQFAIRVTLWRTKNMLYDPKLVLQNALNCSCSEYR